MAEGDGVDGASGGVTSRTVFLGYASQGTEIANAVCRELENRGIRCWIAPRDVAPGALYADAIVRAINKTNVLVVVLSQNAVASPHVGREIERAASKRKPIIALRVDTAPLSPALEYFLSESQWIDVPALGMPGALAKLADAVGKGAAWVIGSSCKLNDRKSCRRTGVDRGALDVALANRSPGRRIDRWTWLYREMPNARNTLKVITVRPDARCR